jgi:NTE family protein
MTTPRKPTLALALGGGSARGWAHIGVIRALEQAGIRPDIVCGTSVGALVGAAYVAGELDRLEEWVRGLKVRDVVALMDVTLRSGLLKGDRLMEFFRRHFPDRPIEELTIPFAAVATALATGAEIWLRCGSTLDAVRASIAVPGLFAPVLHDGVVLVDGGLVNPVPVSLARAMGAEVVIAVDLGSDLLGRHLHTESPPEGLVGAIGDWIRKLQNSVGLVAPAHPTGQTLMPSLYEVVASSINIMQVRIARSRMAGEPPDVIVAPRLAHVRLLDFHRAKEAIEEGRRAVERVAETLALVHRGNIVNRTESCGGPEVTHGT